MDLPYQGLIASWLKMVFSTASLEYEEYWRIILLEYSHFTDAGVIKGSAYLIRFGVSTLQELVVSRRLHRWLFEKVSFGMDFLEYEEYAKNIRLEYSHYADEEYAYVDSLT